MATLSIVVPVYFNAESLPALAEKFRSLAVGPLAGDSLEFVFVDDGSGDDSFTVLRRLAEGDARFRLLRLSRNFGSNAAILAGLTYARGDAAVVISADLQDPPELIPDLVAAWRRGSEVVLAARKSRNDPSISALFARTTNRLLRRFVFRDFPPEGFDFMLVDRCVMDVMARMAEKNSYIFGQALWVGFRREVVYYDRQERPWGTSRWTLTKKVKYLIDIFTAFSYLPVRLASTIGVALAGLGFLYALLVIALRLVGDVPVTGWASLTTVVLITSGVQLILLGVLGEYLWRVLDESRHRPPFIVDCGVNAPPRDDQPAWSRPAKPGP